MKYVFLSLLCIVAVSHSHAQGHWGPAAVFYYDGGGNRIIRQIETIWIPRHSDTSSAPVIVDSLSKIKAYPNPVNNDLFIENMNWTATDEATVVVFDIGSKVVLKQDFSQAKDKISFSKLTPGSYLVQYYLNNNVAQIWKIIKQ